MYMTCKPMRTPEIGGLSTRSSGTFQPVCTVRCVCRFLAAVPICGKPRLPRRGKTTYVYAYAYFREQIYVHGCLCTPS